MIVESKADEGRARDVIAGEDAVKAAGEKNLPRLDSQSEEEYAAYKARALDVESWMLEVRLFGPFPSFHAEFFCLNVSAGH